MEAMRDTHHHGRRAMIGAFVKVSDAARRADVDEGWISAMHGLFFDGNARAKAAFGAAVLLVEVWRPMAS